MRRKRSTTSRGMIYKRICRVSGGAGCASSQLWLLCHHSRGVSARLKGWDPLDIGLVCVPYQGDVTRWGYALGPQAFVDRGLGEVLEQRGHHVSSPIWID